MKRLIIFITFSVLSLSFSNTSTSYLPNHWGNELAYKVSLPDNYSERNDWPVMFYFHGNGGQGNDGRNNPPDSSLWKEQVVMIAPQAQQNKTWWNKAQRDGAKAILDYEINRLNVNSNKILIIGQSMGGYASYLFTQDHPSIPCAVVPISGGWGNYNGGNPSSSGYPANMSPWNHIPYWIFHGNNDNVVKKSCAEQAYQLMTEDNIITKYTLFHNQAHHPRNHVYNSQILYDWAFSQERNTPINFQLSIKRVNNTTEVIGYYEEGEIINISAEIPGSDEEIFIGWSDESGTYYESTGGNKTTISYPSNNGYVSGNRNLTTTYVMPNSDIILNPRFIQKPEIIINKSNNIANIIINTFDEAEYILQKSPKLELTEWNEIERYDSSISTTNIQTIESGSMFYRLDIN